MANLILFESASGYALFERTSSEDVAKLLSDYQNSVAEYGNFSRICKLKSFAPFDSAEHALENAMSISEGALHDFLKNFLEVNLKGTKNVTIGVSEPKLGSAIQEATGFKCTSNDTINEMVRGIRLHFHKFIPELKQGDLEKAQLGLTHSYSRSKVKFNVNRVDNMIIQSIALLDQLDKDLNTFAMRVREWYSWHFPELVKIVNDNYTFARLAVFIKHKNSLTEDKLEGLKDIIGDEDKAKEVYEAAKSSMGTDLSETDMVNIEAFATRVVQLSDYRKKLHEYLCNKMHNVAPNLTALIGEQVGARLIANAGSLTNLSKAPASTVQILGAEKALFRALKTKGNTPKYGLIYHSSFIGRAGAKDKGRISRYLANKCAIASRIDSFSEFPTSTFGEMLKEQVEERLAFYSSGAKPRKNIDVMKEAEKKYEEEKKAAGFEDEATQKKRKRDEEETTKTKKDKKDKKEKKAKKDKKDESDEEMVEAKKETHKKEAKKEEAKETHKKEANKEAKKEEGTPKKEEAPKKEKKDKKEKKEKKDKKKDKKKK